MISDKHNIIIFYIMYLWFPTYLMVGMLFGIVDKNEFRFFAMVWFIFYSCVARHYFKFYNNYKEKIL